MTLNTYNSQPMSLPSPYQFLHLTVSEISPGQDIKGQGHYSDVIGQIKVTPLHCTPTTSPHQCPYEVFTSNILWVKVTMARSKVKSRSYHDVAYLKTLTNVPTKYQLPAPYRFQDITRLRFYRSRSLLQGQRSNQGHTMMMHTYTP